MEIRLLATQIKHESTSQSDKQCLLSVRVSFIGTCHFGRALLHVEQAGCSALSSRDELKPSPDPASSSEPENRGKHTYEALHEGRLVINVT